MADTPATPSNENVESKESKDRMDVVNDHFIADLRVKAYDDNRRSCNDKSRFARLITIKCRDGELTTVLHKYVARCSNFVNVIDPNPKSIVRGHVQLLKGPFMDFAASDIHKFLNYYKYNTPRPAEPLFTRLVEAFGVDREDRILIDTFLKTWVNRYVIDTTPCTYRLPDDVFRHVRLTDMLSLILSRLCNMRKEDSKLDTLVTVDIRLVNEIWDKSEVGVGARGVLKFVINNHHASKSVEFKDERFKEMIQVPVSSSTTTPESPLQIRATLLSSSLGYTFDRTEISGINERYVFGALLI